MDAERARLEQNARREKHWRRWGPYLTDREWGTVREDYSADGKPQYYFPHDHARSRAYRWSEDGIGGISDNHQRLCFAPAFWNGRDSILKERLFGLLDVEGNHGEDVKEYYYFLDNLPSHAYMQYLYKYPQGAYPYEMLRAENARRGRLDPEYELIDTGALDSGRYFDIFLEYAKADENDILIRITVANRASEEAALDLLPMLWFRNTWSWRADSARPELRQGEGNSIDASHATLGAYRLHFQTAPGRFLFTENESNTERLWGVDEGKRFYKDAFHEFVIHGREDAVNPGERGTRACGWYRLRLAAGGSWVLRLRLAPHGALADPFEDFDRVFTRRIAETGEFYQTLAPQGASEDVRCVQRQAFAGLLWSKQYYHFVVDEWLAGDPALPPPPDGHREHRNQEWHHLYNEDIVSMPDTWEYPWYASWDLVFHMIPMALVDPDFAKEQLALFTREWYMHPNGQLPAFEWNFSNVDPPVHAWAAWRVFKLDKKRRGQPDYPFLERVFHKLLLNFTWWVNRKDAQGNNIFEGGFLGLDNISLFDRSQPLPGGGLLEQSDGTSWMAMYCLSMLRIAVELALVNPVYEDIASKFFEHFLYIAHAMNHVHGAGLWDEEDGFYYDHIHLPDGGSLSVRARSLVGLIPLIAVDTLEPFVFQKLAGLRKRIDWFVQNRPDLCVDLPSIVRCGQSDRRLLALVPPERLRRVLSRMLDESEFLSPYGIRSLSRDHAAHPFVARLDGGEQQISYEPAESSEALYGGNSNWRGPVWFPANFLLIESLQKFHHYFGDSFRVEFPSGSGHSMNLAEVAAEISRRLIRLFLRDRDQRRPVFGASARFQTDPRFRDYVPFYEYFHGDNGAGLGASHQTGWTALVAKLIQQSGAGMK